MSDELIAQIPEGDYKDLIKSKVHETAWKELETLKEGHSKVRDNIYAGYNHIQSYLKNRNITSRQSSIMFSLRSKTIRSIKANFPKQFSSLLCPLCEAHEDSQENLLVCKVLQNILPNNHIQYAHMRGTDEQQTKFLQVYEKYLHIRDELLDNSGLGSSLPGLYSGPVRPLAASTGRAVGSDAASTCGVNPADVS